MSNAVDMQLFRGNVCRPWMSHELPSPARVSINFVTRCSAYHFEIVQLLLDLLSQKRRQPVTRRDIPPSIILAARPRFMELDAGAEDQALGHHIKSPIRLKIVFAGNLHPIIPLSRSALVLGGTRNTGVR